jgi:hypothetical protein
LTTRGSPLRWVTREGLTGSPVVKYLPKPR